MNTIAASSSIRRFYAIHSSHTLRHNAKSLILELDNNVRLNGLLNTSIAKEPKNKPLVIFIHGWLGCANSLYQLPLASSLYEKGFNVFRLNLRDHGGSEHLNRELFHSCRLDEVLNVTLKVQNMIPHSKLILIGFSLGGNFALRIGAHAKKHKLKISKIISVCPVIDPTNVLNETKSMLSIYTEYYLRKWKNILQKKHQHFPNDLNIREIKKQTTLTQMTEHLLLKYTEFNCLRNYLNGYGITGEKLKLLDIETEVFIAEDDPIIPASDREKLLKSQHLNINVTNFGGHCGFLTGLFNTNWIDIQIIKSLT